MLKSLPVYPNIVMNLRLTPVNPFKHQQLIKGKLLLSIYSLSYVWYSVEKLAGDLLFGLKFMKLLILPMLFIQFVRAA